MDAEEVSRLFQRYYRGTNTDEKAEGTGLGMAIAKQMLKLIMVKFMLRARGTPVQ